MGQITGFQGDRNEQEGIFIFYAHYDRNDHAFKRMHHTRGQ